MPTLAGMMVENNLNNNAMTDTTASAALEPCPERLTNPLKRYFLATRPPFLLASLVPCLVGLAIATADGISINAVTALLTMVGAVVFHAAANVLNDYYDALNGTDEFNTTRLYPFTGGSRFIQNGVLSRGQTARFGLALLMLGVVVGLVLLAESGVGLLWLGLAGTVIAWAYSAPPLALNSRGLGELCIALAFGLFIVSGADYVQRGSWELTPWLAAIPYGLLTSSLLYINQFPDREADARAGKHHWVVRLGPERARWGYLVLVLAANACLLALVGLRVLAPWSLLALLAAPLGLVAATVLIKHADEPARLVPAIRLTILSVLAHGTLLALGLLLGSG